MAALALISMLLPASTSKPVEVVTRPVPMYKVGLAARFLMSTTRRASRAGTIAVTAVVMPAVVRLLSPACSHRLHRLHLLALHLFRPFLVTPLGLGLNRRILLLVLLPQVHHRLKVVGQVVHVAGLGFQADLVQPAPILVFRMQAAELALGVQKLGHVGN